MPKCVIINCKMIAQPIEMPCSKTNCRYFADCLATYEEYSGKPMTNADRIRAMSDEELAEFLSDDERACPPKWHNCRKHINECGGCWLEWLKQPAEGE